MRPRKKNISLVENLPDAPPIDAPETETATIAADVKPVKRVKNFLRQEWEDVVVEKPAAPPAEPLESVVLIDGEYNFLDEPPDNPIDELLKEIGNAGDDHKAVVYELPNYHVDGNSSIAHAETVFCGTVSIPPHFRSKGELLQLIQEKYAKPGKEFYDFSIVVKSRRIKRVLPVVRVRPIAGNEPKPAQTSGADNAIPTINQRDPLEELEKNAKIFERLKKIFGNTAPPSESVIPNGQPLTTEAAILKLISDDPDKVSQITAKFLGAEKSDAPPAWLSALLPLAMPLLTTLVQRMTVPAPAQPEPVAAQALAKPPEIAASPTAPPPMPPFAAKYQYLIGRVLYGIENDLGGAYIGEEIAMMCDRDPQLDAAFSGFVGTPTTDIKAQLATISPKSQEIVSADNADKFLADLQAYLRGEEESEEGA